MNDYFFFYIKGLDSVDGIDFPTLRTMAEELGVEIKFLQNGNIEFFGARNAVENVKQFLKGEVELDTTTITLSSLLGTDGDQDTNGQEDLEGGIKFSDENSSEAELFDAPNIVDEIVARFDTDIEKEVETQQAEVNKTEKISELAQEVANKQDTKTEAVNNQSQSNNDGEIDGEFRLIDKPVVEAGSVVQDDGITSSNGAIKDVVVQEHQSISYDRGQDLKVIEEAEPIVVPPNVDPVANDDMFVLGENAGSTELWNNALSNDVDDELLSISSVNLVATVGSVVLDTGARSLQYLTGSTYDALAVGETATDSFAYIVDDGRGGSATATVTITITGVNDDPDAAADAFTIGEGTTDAGLHATFLSNDSDVDTSDTIDIISVDDTGLTGVLAFDSGADTLSYTASGFDSLALGVITTETFSYTVGDENGGTDTQSVTVTIIGANDDPDARDDDVSTDEDTNLAGNVFVDNGNGADSDVDTGDTFSVVLGAGETTTTIAGANGGSFILSTNGDFTFNVGDDFQSLDEGESQSTSIAYTISDNNGGTNTATLSVIVTGLNDAPVAQLDSTQGEVDEGGDTITISEAALMANDTDPENDALEITDITVSAGQGSIFDNGDGTWTYTSPADSASFGGYATLTYTLADDGGLTDTASFDIRVFNVITGTAGDDTMTFEGYSTPHKYLGLDGDDHITGTEDRDIFIGGNGNSTMLGDAGNDDFIFEGILTGTNIIEGGSGTDKILGSDGDDSFTIASFTGIEEIDAGTGNDTFYGTVGDDTYVFADVDISGLETLDGNGGTDIILGTGSDDRIDLQNVTTIVGIDHIDAMGGNDVVVGSQSADHIYATVGSDALHGEGGDDFFYIFGTENFDNPDGFFGGDGYDTILGSDDDDDIAIDGTSYRGFSSIEEIDGGLGVNRILGDDYGSKKDDVLDFSNTILTNIDYIDGRGGNDTISGSQGADTFKISSGRDILNGNSGDDIFELSGVMSDDNEIHGGDGTDSIIGSAGDDTLKLSALSGIELIDGGTGTNILQVGYKDTVDLSHLTEGVDFLNFSYLTDYTSAETLHATQGNDTIVIYTDNSADKFYGHEGDDTFIIDGRQNGDDVYDGGDGVDSLIGSDGDDVIRMVSFTNFEHVDLGAGTNIIQADYGDMVDFSSFAAADFLNVTEIRDEDGASRITGSQGDDTIRMNADSAADVFNGHLGDDTFVFSGSLTGDNRLDGGDGNDSLIGSDGDDFLRFDVLSGIEYIDLDAGTNTLSIGSNTSMDFSAYDGTNFLNVTYLVDTGGTETIIGSQTDDTFRVYDDNKSDTLSGGDGDDTFVIIGENSGSDIISGGSGTNRIIGTDDDDSFIITNVSGIETIDLGAGENTIYGEVNGVLDVSGYAAGAIVNAALGDRSGAEAIEGTAEDNIFRINNDASDDIFNGGDGDDTFIISGSNTAEDFISGGNGTDQIIGTSGDDSFIFTNVSGIETIDLGAGDDSITVASGAVLDLSGYAAGTVQNASITDSSGVETIYGTQGDDMIISIGDNNSDVLYGEDGADIFFFDEVAAQSDTIGDFDANEGDAIDISNILSNYDEMTDAIADFVALTTAPGSSQVTLSIDVDGADNGANFVDLVVFDSVNQTLEQMITNGSINI